MFLGVHSIATDSKGNIYTTETYTGKRLQKFVFKGVGPVTSKAGRALAEDQRQLAEKLRLVRQDSGGSSGSRRCHVRRGDVRARVQRQAASSMRTLLTSTRRTSTDILRSASGPGTIEVLGTRAFMSRPSDSISISVH